MGKTLIKNAHIVTESKVFDANIVINNHKIEQITDSITESNFDSIIDASSYIALPGAIDPHVHLFLPTPAGYSSDDFESGSLAALMGGTTTFIDFVTPLAGQSLAMALQERISEAQTSLLDHSFHVSPVSWTDATAKDMKECLKQGITSFKVYMAYRKTIGLSDEALFNVLKTAAALNAIVCVHAESGDQIDGLAEHFVSQGHTQPLYHSLSRPDDLEAQAVDKVLNMAAQTHCALYIVHVSSAKSLQHIRRAKQNGQLVYAETCPHYLLLSDERYQQDFTESSKYVMSPPLRKPQDNQALWEALADGTLDTVGTDHCPFTLTQKDEGQHDFRKIPNGIGGIEHRLTLLYTYGVLKQRISLQGFVQLVATNPARIFGLYPQKGTLQAGSDADIILWNPNARRIISAGNQFQNCDYSIYEGMETRGYPEMVFLKGKLQVKNNNYIGDNLKGNFLPRK